MLSVYFSPKVISLSGFHWNCKNIRSRCPRTYFKCYKCFEREISGTTFKQQKSSSDWSLLYAFKQLLNKKAKANVSFCLGITHFVKNHFVENHKDDQKISGWSICWKVTLPFWRDAYGVTYEPPRPVRIPRKCKGMKERTEGDLGSFRGFKNIFCWSDLY